MTFPSKATHQQTRAYNESLVLRALYDHSPISRAEVARMSGLTRTTVGEVVGGLIAEGMAREVGRGPSTGGKAPILLELVDGARHVVGLDLGEFVFRGGLVDLRGQVHATVERKVEGLDGEAALAVVHELVDELAEGRRTSLLGIGVGTPGIVDAEEGTIRWAANLEWHDLPLAEIVRDRFGVPVQVANDSRAAALAIQLFSDRGAGGDRRASNRGSSDRRPTAEPGAGADRVADGEDAPRRSLNLIAIKVGRGIGAGLVLGGELFHGDGFGAGEIGHTVVDVDGAECRCGRFGCLETVASSRAIVREATEAALADPRGPLGRRLAARGSLDLADVRVALEAGDEAARRVVVAAGRWLGQGIGTVIGLLDVERIVLHGSVTTLGAPWIEAVRDEAGRRTLRTLSSATSIEVIASGDDLVVRGASALLLTAELGLATAR